MNEITHVTWTLYIWNGRFQMYKVQVTQSELSKGNRAPILLPTRKKGSAPLQPLPRKQASLGSWVLLDFDPLLHERDRSPLSLHGVQREPRFVPLAKQGTYVHVGPEQTAERNKGGQGELVPPESALVM